MNRFVYIKDILGIKTNLNKFTCLYGSCAPLCEKADFERCLLKLEVLVVSDKDVFAEGELESADSSFQHFKYKTAGKKLYYDRKFLLGKRLCYSIELNENTIRARVGRTYLKTVKYKFMNLHSIGYILSDIITVMLLKNGYESMYCSAAELPSKNSSVAVFGPPGTGKTVSVIELCRGYGGRFISEDVALTDGEYIYSVPWTSSYRKKNKNLLDSREKNANTVEAFQKSEQYCEKAKLSHVFLLESGSNYRSCSGEALIDKVTLLNRYLFHYRESPVNTVLSYLDPAFSLEDAERCQGEILKRLDGATKKICVSAPNATEFGKVIWDEISIKGGESYNKISC